MGAIKGGTPGALSRKSGLERHAHSPRRSYATAQPLAGPQCFVARGRPHLGRFPRTCILARWNDGLRIAPDNRRMTCLGVVGAIATNAANRFVQRVWLSNSGNMGTSPTLLSVTSMARISSVWASMPRCTRYGPLHIPVQPNRQRASGHE